MAQRVHLSFQGIFNAAHIWCDLKSSDKRDHRWKEVPVLLESYSAETSTRDFPLRSLTGMHCSRKPGSYLLVCRMSTGFALFCIYFSFYNLFLIGSRLFLFYFDSIHSIFPVVSSAVHSLETIISVSLLLFPLFQFIFTHLWKSPNQKPVFAAILTLRNRCLA